MIGIVNIYAALFNYWYQQAEWEGEVAPLT